MAGGAAAGHRSREVRLHRVGGIGRIPGICPRRDLRVAARVVCRRPQARRRADRSSRHRVHARSRRNPRSAGRRGPAACSTRASSARRSPMPFRAARACSRWTIWWHIGPSFASPCRSASTGGPLPATPRRPSAAPASGASVAARRRQPVGLGFRRARDPCQGTARGARLPEAPSRPERRRSRRRGRRASRRCISQGPGKDPVVAVDGAHLDCGRRRGHRGAR